MQKVVGSSPIIRFKEPANQQVPYSVMATSAASWLHWWPDRCDRGLALTNSRLRRGMSEGSRVREYPLQRR